MKKRILSLLMVLVLCFSLVPAEALATETKSGAPAAQEEVKKDDPAPNENGGNGGGDGDAVIIPAEERTAAAVRTAASPTIRLEKAAGYMYRPAHRPRGAAEFMSPR